MTIFLFPVKIRRSPKPVFQKKKKKEKKEEKNELPCSCMLRSQEGP
jgi:hypothetical protein